MTEIWLRVDATEPVEILSALSSDLNLSSASSRIEMEGSVRSHRPADPCSEDVLGLYPDVVITGYKGEITLIRSDPPEDISKPESDDGDPPVLRRGRLFVNPEHEYFSLLLFLPDKQYARVLEHARLGSLPERISINLSEDIQRKNIRKGEGLVSEYEIRYSLDRSASCLGRGESQKRRSDLHQTIIDSTARFFGERRDRIDWSVYGDRRISTICAQLLLSAGQQADSLALLDEEREMLFGDVTDLCKTVSKSISSKNGNSQIDVSFWGKKPTGPGVLRSDFSPDDWLPDMTQLKHAVSDYLNHEFASPLFEWVSIDALCYRIFIKHIQEAELANRHRIRSWSGWAMGRNRRQPFHGDRVRAVYQCVECSTPPAIVRRLLEGVAADGIPIEGDVFAMLIRAERRNPESWWLRTPEIDAAHKIEKQIHGFAVEAN